MISLLQAQIEGMDIGRIEEGDRSRKVFTLLAVWDPEKIPDHKENLDSLFIPHPSPSIHLNEV